MSVELHLVEPPVDEPEREVGPEVELRHLRHVTSSMLSGALSVWADIQGEFEGVVHHGNLVDDRARAGFVPRCGWPEFLERMRALEHYLTHTQRIASGD